MADGDVVADNSRTIFTGNVDHGAILNIGPFANADAINVASDHAAEPNTGILTDHDITDHHGTGAR